LKVKIAIQMNLQNTLEGREPQRARRSATPVFSHSAWIVAMARRLFVVPRWAGTSSSDYYPWLVQELKTAAPHLQGALITCSECIRDHFRLTHSWKFSTSAGYAPGMAFKSLVVRDLVFFFFPFAIKIVRVSIF
jgi:hypothetical protein